ncbi:HAD family hydrolase [Paenibacillus sp. LHD-38]|uniref:HAD family hydrolase n=1 Tax=Paenibacillus sp. LHD-38 TaxID=3072143 RepID=UPI00280FA452|nr:HAD family hydrolase [Paenibacillus sp. LHD-38]MDQ8738072.1 HAD family hydrolase [Paenibacillus sp. LHD-38]
MNNILSVVLDLDGTLLNTQREVSQRNLHAVLDCHKNGIQIIIATARPSRSVRMLLPEALLQLGCMIYYNGAHTVDSSYETEDHVLIDHETVSDLYDAITAQSGEPLVCFEAQDAIFCNRSLASKHFDILGMPSDAPIPTVLSREGINQLCPSKLLFPNVQNIYTELKSSFSHRVKLILTDGSRLVQIMNSSVSKAGALGQVLNRRGLHPDQVMVFGDDYNDLELFDLCGYPVAMGNAINELKIKAARITETNDDDGVAAVLEALLQSRRTAGFLST